MEPDQLDLAHRWGIVVGALLDLLGHALRDRVDYESARLSFMGLHGNLISAPVVRTRSRLGNWFNQKIGWPK